MKKLIALILAVLMVAGMFAGCAAKTESTDTKASDSEAAQTETNATEETTDSSDASSETSADAGELHIGVLAPLTGNWAEHGKGFQVAMDMAAEEINAAGGVNGKKIVMEYGDTEGDNQKATDVATQFAEDPEIVAMLGDFSSGCCMAAAPVCDEYGIVLISPSASNVAFAQMSEYCFSVGGKSSEEAPFLLTTGAAGIYDAKSVVIFGLNSDWGESAFAGAEAGAAEAGIEVLASEKYVSGETDFSALITKAKAANPDMIIILDQAPAVLINQIRSAGIDTPIGIFGASTSQEVIDLCGENAEGCIVTGSFFLDENDPVDSAFQNTFTERAGFSPTVMATSAYVVTYLVAHAAERCGDEVTREGIMEQLKACDEDSLLGQIVFDEDGNLSLHYRICRVEDGAWKIVDYDYE